MLLFFFGINNELSLLDFFFSIDRFFRCLINLYIELDIIRDIRKGFLYI